MTHSLGLKFLGSNIILFNAYEKFIFHGSWHSRIEPSTKTTNIGTPCINNINPFEFGIYKETSTEMYTPVLIGFD